MPLKPDCSFCYKPKEEVEHLIEGPMCYICDQCVALCQEILQEERSVPPDPQPMGNIYNMVIPYQESHRERLEYEQRYIAQQMKSLQTRLERVEEELK